MRSARLLLLAAYLALPAVARADVTVIYASGPPPPLVARPVETSETSGTAASGSAERRSLAEPTSVSAPEPAPTRELPAPTRAAPPAPIRDAPASPAPSPASPERAETAPAARPLEPCEAPAPVQLAVRDERGETQLVRLSLVDCRAAPDERSVATLSGMTGGTPSISLHPGLAERLAALAAHFPGRRIEILSGIRADASERSRHRHGLALDLRVVGVSLDALASFARSFPRTGVGVHRSAGFVHLDVRTERVHWTDDAAPGERARPIRDASRAPAPLSEDPRHILDDAFRALDELRIDFEPPAS